MPVEIWVLGILGAIAWIIGGFLAVRYVLPILRAGMADIIRNNKATQAFILLLTYFVYITVATGVIASLTGIGDRYLSYITVVNPILALLNSLVPYIQWIIIGLAAIIVAERIKR